MLRIMSNNLWWCDDNRPAWAEMGLDCSAAARADGFCRVYATLQPDVIGLQECSALMADELMQRFPAYGLPYALLWGHDTPILFRKDRFDLVDSAFLLYPEEFPGHEGSFNNWRTKSYLTAVLRCKADGKHLIVATTHLWWKSSRPDSPEYQPHSAEARAYQLGLLMDTLDALQEQYACPAIMLGDFNAGYGSLTLQSAMARGWQHAHDTAAEYADNGCGHHPCDSSGYAPYVPGDFRRSLDQIMHLGAPEGFVRRFDRYAEEDYMPLSDHLPVWVDVTL
ncbi:MAG: endonuclease/exonuclease/phosphatase family protein [Clostridia bacterium]|nr:endonuclease/exonuclease/phosphatase family protein [Clostridia bacterium]